MKNQGHIVYVSGNLIATFTPQLDNPSNHISFNQSDKLCLNTNLRLTKFYHQ